MTWKAGIVRKIDRFLSFSFRESAHVNFLVCIQSRKCIPSSPPVPCNPPVTDTDVGNDEGVNHEELVAFSVQEISMNMRLSTGQVSPQANKHYSYDQCCIYLHQSG